MSLKRMPLLALAMLAGTSCASGPGAGPADSQAATQGVVFERVNVIPMDREGVVLRDQTVVVRDGRIAAVGPSASTPAPAGLTRVDASGRYLIPGLAEMHGHIPGLNPANEAGSLQAQEDVLFLYVAGGATTVRGMQGHPAHLPMRERVERGELVGPRLYLSSPAMSANSAPDAATAERLVREHHEAGYDHLKVHEGIPADAYAAIARTATQLGMGFGGHISDLVGLDGALAAKQTTIDHLDNYIDAANPQSSPAHGLAGWPRLMALAENADHSRIPELARRTREAGIAVVPTQALWEVLRGAHPASSMIDRPENRYMPRATVQAWVNSANNAVAQTRPSASAAELRFRDAMLKALSDAGVPILLGTDAPQVFSVPGFSLQREVLAMRKAGMTPWQILVSGTTAVAAHLGTQAEIGTVTAGRHADLILLDANPLDDIGNISRIAGVVMRGRWFSRQALDARLNEIAARNAN
jgi:imidazolonepropionase-like amidohydrolase